MSQMSVATTVARRASKGSTRTALHVVRSTDRAGSAWFPVMCVALLLAGLTAVLMLNTMMAHDSFEVGKLEERSARLSDTEAALTQQVNSRSAPQNLAESAADLGMVPSTSAAFVDLERDEVLGVAKVAQDQDAINVGAGATATAKESSKTSDKDTKKDAKDKASDTKKSSDKDRRKDEAKDKDAKDAAARDN